MAKDKETGQGGKSAVAQTAGLKKELGVAAPPMKKQVNILQAVQHTRGQVDAMDVTGEAAYTEILHASKQEMDATVKKLERARAELKSMLEGAAANSQTQLMEMDAVHKRERARLAQEIGAATEDVVASLAQPGDVQQSFRELMMRLEGIRESRKFRKF